MRAAGAIVAGGIEREFAPMMDEPHREHLLAQWRRAVERARGWAAGGAR